MTKRWVSAFLFPSALLMVFSARLGADEYHVDTKAPNRVGFTAKFMGETFQGATGKIDGYVVWKNADPEHGAFEGSDLYFEVDLNTLDTGIGMRNNHMRENYLHTGKYPFASYKGKIVKTARPGGTELLVDVDGVMTIHGTDKFLAVTGRARVDGDRVHLTCAFPLDIRDFKIEVPSLMGMKVGEILDMELDVTLVKVH